MGFDKAVPDAELDRALGMPPAFGAGSPWTPSGPGETDRAFLQQRAREVLNGSGSFSPEEMQKAVAFLVLRG